MLPALAEVMVATAEGIIYANIVCEYARVKGWESMGTMWVSRHILE